MSVSQDHSVGTANTGRGPLKSLKVNEIRQPKLENKGAKKSRVPVPIARRRMARIEMPTKTSAGDDHNIEPGLIPGNGGGGSGEHAPAPLRRPRASSLGIMDVSHMTLKKSDISMIVIPVARKAMSKNDPGRSHSKSSVGRDDGGARRRRPMSLFTITLIRAVFILLSWCLELIKYAMFIFSAYLCVVTICGIFFDAGILMELLQEYHVAKYMPKMLLNLFVSNHGLAVVFLSSVCVYFPIFQMPPPRGFIVLMLTVLTWVTSTTLEFSKAVLN